MYSLGIEPMNVVLLAACFSFNVKLSVFMKKNKIKKSKAPHQIYLKEKKNRAVLKFGSNISE